MTFRSEIEAAQPTAEDIAHRRWIYVPYDRYTDRVGPISEQAASDTGIVIVESTAKALRRPYHKKKLVVLISNMRHFALEQAARGVAVLYHFSPLSHGQALLDVQRSHGLPTLTCMTPAERELRLDLNSARQRGLAMDFVEDLTWASTAKDFTDVYGGFQAGQVLCHGPVLPADAGEDWRSDEGWQACWREVLVRCREPESLSQ